MDSDGDGLCLLRTRSPKMTTETTHRATIDYGELASAGLLRRPYLLTVEACVVYHVARAERQRVDDNYTLTEFVREVLTTCGRRPSPKHWLGFEVGPVEVPPPTGFVPEWEPGMQLLWAEQNGVEAGLVIDDRDDLEITVGFCRVNGFAVVLPRL